MNTNNIEKKNKKDIEINQDINSSENTNDNNNNNDNDNDNDNDNESYNNNNKENKNYINYKEKDNIIIKNNKKENNIIKNDNNNNNNYNGIYNQNGIGIDIYNNIDIDIDNKQENIEQQFIGCNCTKSNCTKKYCECFKAGKKCTDSCRCWDCDNITPIQQELKLKKKYKKLAHNIQSPYDGYVIEKTSIHIEKSNIFIKESVIWDLKDLGKINYLKINKNNNEIPQVNLLNNSNSKNDKEENNCKSKCNSNNKNTIENDNHYHNHNRKIFSKKKLNQKDSNLSFYPIGIKKEIIKTINSNNNIINDKIKNDSETSSFTSSFSAKSEKKKNFSKKNYHNVNKINNINNKNQDNIISSNNFNKKIEVIKDNNNTNILIIDKSLLINQGNLNLKDDKLDCNINDNDNNIIYDYNELKNSNFIGNSNKS
jgi:hypothetical protein